MTDATVITGDRIVSVKRQIAAPAATIFDLLADPSKHHLFDGSGTVVAGRDSNPERLSAGARFGMDMKLGLPYRMTNEVVAFEENQAIAWRHFGHHVWRYDLEPIDEQTTMVTESFNWGVARFPPMYEWAGYPTRHIDNMTATLARLAEVVEQ
jgi:uncharacterized protein YndB with AHSA1/START domain